MARRALLGQAAASAVVGGGLLALAYAHDNALLAGAAGVQVLAVLGFLALTEAPAAAGVAAIALAAAVASDVIVVVDDGRARYLGGVVGLSLVVGILHQLVRRDRARVTESLADTLVSVVLVTAAASLAGGERLSDWPTRAGLAAAAAALVVGRLGDLVQRVLIAPGRTWPGLVLGLAAGAGAAKLVGHLSTGRSLLLGLTAAAAVAAADLLIALAGSESTDERRRAALRPTAVLVPYALLGPVVVTAIRLLDR